MKHLLILALLFFSASVSFASPVHVGPGQPYPDVNTASHARAIHAGDTVYLHGGTYGSSPYHIDSLMGRPDAWIVIKPYGDGLVYINVAWLLQTVQYVRFSGLHFFGNDTAHRAEVYHLMQFDYAYDCYTRNHDIVIEGCGFTDLNNTGKQGSGAFLKFTGCDNFLVENCTFRNGTNVADGISMNGNRNGVIRGCTFQNISGYGSHTKGGTKNILYERNTFIDCMGAGLDVGGDTGPQFFCPLGAPWECDSIRVYSNIFIGGRVAVQLSSAHHAFIVNNTCFKQTQFSFRLLNASTNHVYVDSNVIANNIFTTTGPIYLNASAGYQYSTNGFFNNVFYPYSGNVPTKLNWSEMAGVSEANNLIADPMFIDTGARDFHLRGSALINAGVVLSEPKTDYFGNTFDSAGRIVGAIETPILRTVRERPAEVTVRIYPDPVRNNVSVTFSDGLPHMVTIVTLAGVNVLKQMTTSTIEVSGLPQGVYYVRTDAGPVGSFVIER